MNAEYLLDAMGLLDDDLVEEAERYSRPKLKANYGRWMGLAASLAVVIALGYALTHLGMGGGSSMAPSGAGAASAPAASTPAAAGESLGGGMMFDNSADGSVDDPEAPEPDEPQGGDQGEQYPVIMVDGVLYRSTGQPVPGEPAEEAIQTVTGYTNSLPEADGQTNFSQDLTAQYAMTGQGLVVLMDNEWVLFEPVPSQYR